MINDDTPTLFSLSRLRVAWIGKSEKRAKKEECYVARMADSTWGRKDETEGYLSGEVS